MSKKPYDLSKLENELKGASAFFKSSLTSEPAADNASASTEVKSSSKETHRSPANEAHQDSPADALPSETVSRTPVRSVRPVRRQMIRHPFELYQDQVEALRHLAADDRMHGGAGSMSAMVREAIDRLIDEQSKSSD